MTEHIILLLLIIRSLCGYATPFEDRIIDYIRNWLEPAPYKNNILPTDYYKIKHGKR